MSKGDACTRIIVVVLFFCVAFLIGGTTNVRAIGGDTSDGAKSFYALWNDTEKSISFSANEPSEGTYEEVKEVKPFIQSHKDEVKTIDFAFTNQEGQSEKIVLGPDEGKTLFNQCSKLTEIRNLTNLDTSGTTSMYGMFNECASLESLDLSAFDTSNVTDMSYMFRNCESLEELDVSSFDTSKVTDMSFMFRLCSAVKKLDLSSFETSNVTKMWYMFNRCYALEDLNVTSFDTSKVTDMECMFYMCSSLKTVDLSSFDTSKVVSMYIMFAYCDALEELDLSSFTTESLWSSVDNWPGLTGLCYYCPNLKSVDISNMSTNRGVKTLQNAFTGCGSLERITLGEKVILAAYTGGHAPSGLSGNWAREDDPQTMYTVSQLIEMFDGNHPENAGTYIRYIPEGHFYRSDGTLNRDNLWEVHTPEERFKGYCLNKFKSGVGHFLDRIEITSNSQFMEYLDSEFPEASIGAEPLGNTVEEALVTIMYYGWPSDKAGIQAKYGLTDDQFMEVTQNAIWDFVDRYNNKSGPENQTEAMIGAYNELLTQRYSSIPEKYTLYIYSSREKDRQNLISIRSLDDDVYGGVEVYKQEINSLPLAGAEFTIYTLDGQVVRTMTTGADGYASICETDSYKGLPRGEYYVEETKAPAGYVRSSLRFYFSIEEANKIVNLGRRTPDGANEYMIFLNREDTGYKGGGISVKKVSEDEKPLIGAEFAVYDDSGSEVMTIISDDEGIASTGLRDLPLGDYTIKETKPPAGYFLTNEEKSFSITEDNQFLKEAFTFTDKGKEGQVQITAKKQFKNGKLKGGEFVFRLTTMEGEVLQEAKSDAEGQAAFEPIKYTAEDQGYANYKIVEVKGDDKGIVYDTHEEIVTVTIIDTGKDTLECTAIYDEDGPLFKNSREPFVEKTINDVNRVVLDNTSREVSYTIKTLVPHDCTNFKIYDDLPSVLEFGSRENFEIKVDGEPEELGFSLTGNRFLLEFTKGMIDKYYGSEIEITFSAHLKQGADLKPYKVKDKYVVNNIARCVIDNETSILSGSEDASLVLGAESDKVEDGTRKEDEDGESAGKGSSTGDPAVIGLYFVLMILALCAAAMIAHRRVRRF